MKTRSFLSLGLAGLTLLLPLDAQNKNAQNKKWNAPLTKDGQPDLQGVWVSNAATPLERPKQLEARESLTDAEVAELQKRADRLFKSVDSDFAAGDGAFMAALANPTVYKSPTSTGGSDQMIERVFDNRTSLVIDPPDGKIPAMTPEGRRRQAEVKSVPDGPEDLTNVMRCITYGVPRLGGNFGSGHYSYYQISQSAGYVVFLMEAIHDARIIPLDGRPHVPSSVRTWNGDSRGRWEGQTLVVDTTNFSSKSNFMGATENLHLVERFTRVAPDEIDQVITVEDPTTWVKPWTAMIRLRSTPEPVYEYACHEGNFFTMTGTLGAAREAEKAESAGKHGH